MSTRYNNGSHYENHHKAAELHDMAAHAHLAAAEHRDHQDHQTGSERSREAMEHSRQAFMQSRAAHHGAESAHPFSDEDIAALAHQLWIERGSPHGSPDEDWHNAVERLKARAL